MNSELFNLVPPLLNISRFVTVDEVSFNYCNEEYIKNKTHVYFFLSISVIDAMYQDFLAFFQSYSGEQEAFDLLLNYEEVRNFCFICGKCCFCKSYNQ